MVAYKDRTHLVDRKKVLEPLPKSDLLGSAIIVDGSLAGSWKRVLNKKHVAIELVYFTALTKAKQKAVEAAASRYGRFLGMTVLITNGKADKL